MTPERYHRIRRVLDRRQPDLAVISENVHKPHNFSALLRTCDSVGVWEAMAVAPEGVLDISRPVAGNVAHWMNVSIHRRIGEAIAKVKAGGLQVLAAHLAPIAVDYRRPDYTRPTALLLGQEKDGVTPEAAQAADGFVVIPMHGMAASLNVSVAAAVILYEMERQRRLAGLYDSVRLDDQTYRRKIFEWGYPRVERYCRLRGMPYPELNEEGQIVGGFSFEGE